MTLNLRLGWGIELPVGSQTNMEVFCENGKVSNVDYSGVESDGHKNMINKFLESNDLDQSMHIDLVEDTMTLINALYKSHLTKRQFLENFVNKNY